MGFCLGQSSSQTPNSQSPFLMDLALCMGPIFLLKQKETFAKLTYRACQHHKSNPKPLFFCHKTLVFVAFSWHPPKPKFDKQIIWIKWQTTVCGWPILIAVSEICHLEVNLLSLSPLAKRKMLSFFTGGQSQFSHCQSRKHSSSPETKCFYCCLKYYVLYASSLYSPFWVLVWSTTLRLICCCS